jgi:polyphenol oxidase
MGTASKKKTASQNRLPAARRAVARSAKPAEWKFRKSAGLEILEAPCFAQQTWLVHGFSTRTGGASKLLGGAGGKPAGTCVLNLGFTDRDLRTTVLANRRKFFRALGAEEMKTVTLHQIHSDIAHRVDRVDRLGQEAAQGDALITREPGIVLAIQTADCIPILLADTKTRAVAAIHSGWRGTLARIALKTLGRMQMEFGTRPRDVIAALGPGIGRCCYRVGPSVVADFDAKFSKASDWFDGPFDALAAGENDPNWLPWLTMKPPGHQPPPLAAHLDLIAANRAILTEAGLEPAHISSSGFCTACRTDRFFSYRQERSTGRMIAAIAIR